MKCFIALAFMLVAVSASEQYTNKYDNTNLDEILGNDRLFNAHMECIMGEGKCTPEGRELKEHIGESLENECEKCTDDQKKGAKKAIDYIIKHRPEAWKRLTDKFDPSGKYKQQYEERAKAEGIALPA
uniref:Sensory protein 1 n=1 Tax=Lonomia obliqua TaxID=304329 RepID=Q5MGD4_LONON|nr:sensory protein 1 [Lonomia obliqua]